MESEVIRKIRAVKQAEWAGWLERWKASGLSVKRFCEEHQLKPCTFRYWQARLSSQQREVELRTQKVPSFTEATYHEPLQPMVMSADTIEIAITTQNGWRIDLKGAGCVTQLRSVVLSLQGLL